MLKKNFTPLLKALVYYSLIKLKTKQTKILKNFNKFTFFYQSDLENKIEVNSTGLFFKKLAFVNMALCTLNINKHKKLTIKSTTNSL